MLELAPADDYAHYALGRCLEKQGKAHEANGHYKLAASLRPGQGAITRRGSRTSTSWTSAVVAARSSARSRRSTPGGEIGAGLLVLLGVAQGDDDGDAERLAGKIARLRIFEDDAGKFDRSLLDVGGAALVVSQFTLIADTAKGNRPSFSGAARPERRRAAVRALLRRAPRARRPRRDRRLRRADAGRARRTTAP